MWIENALKNQSKAPKMFRRVYTFSFREDAHKKCFFCGRNTKRGGGGKGQGIEKKKPLVILKNLLRP